MVKSNTLIILIVNLLITASLIYFYDQQVASKNKLNIASIDIKGYIEGQRSLFLDDKITEEELNANIKKLQERIDHVSDNTILLSKEAVVKGAKDTEIIKP